MTAPEFPEAERLALVEDVRCSLEWVYDGAHTFDAEALLDHLSDRGLKVVRA